MLTLSQISDRSLCIQRNIDSNLDFLFVVWIAKVSGSKGALELISIVFSRQLAQ